MSKNKSHLKYDPKKEGNYVKTNKQTLNYQEKWESKAAGKIVGFIYFLE